MQFPFIICIVEVSCQQTRVLARFKILVPPISRATKEAIQRNLIESRN